MKYKLEVVVSKTSGPDQDTEDVLSALTEELEALTFEADDGEHDEPSTYEVRSAVRQISAN